MQRCALEQEVLAAEAACEPDSATLSRLTASYKVAFEHAAQHTKLSNIRQLTTRAEAELRGATSHLQLVAADVAALEELEQVATGAVACLAERHGLCLKIHKLDMSLDELHSLASTNTALLGDLKREYAHELAAKER